MLLMVKDNASYVEAFHDLFGLDFAKKSKEFIDNVKDLLPTTNIYNYEKKSIYEKGNPSGKSRAYKRGSAYNNQSFGGCGDRQT